MIKKIGIFAALAVLIIGLWFWNKKRMADQELEAYLHRKIESKFILNEHQKIGMPPADPKAVKVIRYQDESATWQVALNQAPEGAKEEMIMGVLHSVPVGTLVNVPLYYCASAAGSSKAVSDLKLMANCSGGKKLIEHPAGYVSREIREGYFLIFHCRNAKSGLYLTLNSRCESAEDTIEDSLGAIRAFSN